ncbi:MAG: hypothetical protein PHH54_00845 [Candidatus Nanoarchaeia archaeon]|nr:hypothetical protein [Candidatus Nanoarchaeia archaeon]MDD5740510.1 hypothetical protein [Candidatus Nanoarchaeia archaeon]
MNLLKRIAIGVVLSVSSISALSNSSNSDVNSIKSYPRRNIHLGYSATKKDNKEIDSIIYYDRNILWENQIENNARHILSSIEFEYADGDPNNYDYKSETLLKKIKENLSPFLTQGKEPIERIVIEYNQPYETCIRKAIINSESKINGFGYIDGGNHGNLDGEVDWIYIINDEKVRFLVRKKDYQTNKRVFEQADKDMKLVKPIVEKTEQKIKSYFNN